MSGVAIGRLQLVKTGGVPGCVREWGVCRGCAGWAAMIRAAGEGEIWRRYPIHCSCTGLTVRVVREGEPGAGEFRADRAERAGS